MQQGIRIAVTLGVGFMLAVCTPAAHALTWSSPTRIATGGGVSLSALACASSTACVTLDINGRAIEFDPVTGTTQTPVTLADSYSDVACPTATQCTIFDTQGHARTFDPTAPITAQPVSVESDDADVAAVACPTATQCTAVASAQGVVTFNPQAPAREPVVKVTTDFSLSDIVCPSVTQCTAAGSDISSNGPESHHDIVTFNPQAPGLGSEGELGDGVVGSIVCPATTQCTALPDPLGTVVTFNPSSPSHPTSFTIPDKDDNAVFGLACPSLTQCTAVGQLGHEFTFNPQSSTVPQQVLVDPNDGGNLIGQNTGVDGFVCLSTTSCLGADGNGQSVAFDPSAPHPAKVTSLDPANPLFEVACPSATVCTALTSNQSIDFDPGHPAASHPTQLTSPQTTGISSVACPTKTLCTAVQGEQAVRFSPQGGTPHRSIIDPSSDEGLSGVVCPTATQCVAVDANGGDVLYDPATGAVIHKERYLNEDTSIDVVACPSVTQCTAVFEDGSQETFAPLTNKLIARSSLEGIDIPSDGGGPSHGVTALQCPSATLCVAVDNRGYKITFDPRSGHHASRVTLDAHHALGGLSCSRARCVAVDDGGRALVGAPQSNHWSVEPIAGAGALSAITCITAGECVAVDSYGNVFVSRP